MKLSAKQLSLFPQSVGPAISIPWVLFKSTIDIQPRLSFHCQQGAFLRSFERTERLSIDEMKARTLDLFFYTSVIVKLPIPSLLATLLIFSPSASLSSMFISDFLTIEQLACVTCSHFNCWQSTFETHMVNHVEYQICQDVLFIQIVFYDHYIHVCAWLLVWHFPLLWTSLVEDLNVTLKMLKAAATRSITSRNWVLHWMQGCLFLGRSIDSWRSPGDTLHIVRISITFLNILGENGMTNKATIIPHTTSMHWHHIGFRFGLLGRCTFFVPEMCSIKFVLLVQEVMQEEGREIFSDGLHMCILLSKVLSLHEI